MSRPESSTRSLPPAVDWLVAAVAVLGTLLALATFLLPGVVSLLAADLASGLVGLASLYPVLGLAVVLLVLAVWGRHRVHRDRSEPSGRSDPDEDVDSPTLSGMTETLHTATAARYRCTPTDAADTVEETLFEGAVRAVRTSRGVDAGRAREAVTAGEWTDDPVAAAFLSEERSYPVRAWLYGHVDPGGAYQRRIERTLDAIDAVRQAEGAS